MYSYSLKLEREHFDRRTADFVYALLFVWLVLLVVAFFFNMMVCTCCGFIGNCCLFDHAGVQRGSVSMPFG